MGEEEFINPNLCTQFLPDGANRGVLLLNDFMLELFQNCTKLAQRILSDHRVFIMPKNSFFFEPLNHKIIQLVESGLAKKFVEEASPKPNKSDEAGPVVLTLEHLGIGFKIVLFFLLISFIFFLLELFAARFQRNFARN